MNPKTRRIYFMKTFFNRKQQNKVDLKAFPLPTVSTLLIPKELLPALDKICFVGYNPKTNKKIYDLRAGLHLLLNKHRGFLALGNLPFAPKPKPVEARLLSLSKHTTVELSRPRLIQQIFGKRRYIHRIITLPTVTKRPKQS